LYPATMRKPNPFGVSHKILGSAACVLVACSATISSAQLASNPAAKAMSDAFVERTKLPRSVIVSIKPDIVIGLRDKPSATSPSAKIGLQGEVIGAEAVERLGYQSMRSLVQINCETRRDRVIEMEVFANPNLKGPSQVRNPPGGWVQPSEDAYMSDVIRAVCRAPTPLIAEEARPQVPDPPKLKPPIRATVPEVRPTVSTPPPTQVAAAATSPVGPGAKVQLAALDSEAAARDVLSKFTDMTTGFLAAKIEPASLNQRLYFRATIVGFRDRREANLFCAKVTARQGTCFVR
jgi:hypothetical protein